MNRNSFLFSCLLNFLLPGSGHGFWREYAFGAFIFLVMILSALLTIVSVVLTLSIWVRAAILIVPLIFFVFTFLDLRRVLKSRRSAGRNMKATALSLTLAIGWQLVSPIAPVNFALCNFPELFRQPDNALSPLYHQGDLLAANSLAYRASFTFVSRPQVFALPEEGEMVRFIDSAGIRRVGLVAGLPGDQVAVIDGNLIVDGIPVPLSDYLGFGVSGEAELTSVDPGSIMVILIRLGAIERVEQVPISEIVGKVHKLF